MILKVTERDISISLMIDGFDVNKIHITKSQVTYRENEDDLSYKSCLLNGATADCCAPF